MLSKLLPLLLLGAACAQPALAQRRVCGPRLGVGAYSAVYLYGLSRHHPCATADTADRPFVASRWGAFMGAAGSTNAHGTFAGAELEGTYRVGPRLQAGLAGTVGIPMRIQSNLGVAEAAKPMLGFYNLTARAHFFLLDNPRLRTGLITGLGAGVATLADRSQQVVDKGQDQSCGCTPSTHAKTVATSVGLVGLVGASATYKLRPDLWLTARSYYQQWAGATQFGRQADLSPWVVSLGITMPDTWK